MNINEEPLSITQKLILENDRDIEEIFGKGINDLSFKSFIKSIKIDKKQSSIEPELSMQDSLKQYEAFLNLQLPENERVEGSFKSSDIFDETIYHEQMRQIAK